MKLGFNLLREQLANEDKWDKIYEWITSTAKVLVIFTELIIVCVFVVRVVVDRRARELTKLLETNHTQLEALATTEGQIRQVQANMVDYTAIWNNSSSFMSVVEEIYSYDRALSNTLMIRLSDQGKIEISGVAKRDDVENLEMLMKSSPTYSYVELISFRPNLASTTNTGHFQLVGNFSPAKRLSFDQL
jgi:hypothetical protein